MTAPLNRQRTLRVAAHPHPARPRPRPRRRHRQRRDRRRLGRAGRSRIAEPIGGMWLNALRMTIVPLVVVAAGHRHRRVRGGGAGEQAGDAGAGAVRRPAVDLGDRRGLADAAAAQPVPAAGRIGGGAARARSAPPRRSARRRASPTSCDRSCRATSVAAAAEDAILPLILFTMVFAFAVTRLPRGAARAAGRLLPGGRRHDADRDQLGAVDRADRRVRSGLCGRRAGRRRRVRRAAPLCADRLGGRRS